MDTSSLGNADQGGHMEGDPNQTSEQQVIEKYIQQYQLESCLDEILNQVVLERPKNPYVAIAHAFESKTMPEILEVKFSPVYHRIGYAVKATVLTNIGPFSAITVYSNSTVGSGGLYEPKEYTVLDGKMTEALIPLDPRNLKQIDETIAAMNDIDPAESLAVSMACCRAAAKYKGIKLFEFIGELANVKKEDMVLPLPVAIIATRQVNNTKALQSVQLFPIKSSAFDLAINKIYSFLHTLALHEKTMKPVRFSPQGNAVIDAPSIEDVAKILNTIMKESEGGSALKMGLGMNQHLLQRQVESSYAYINETGQQKTGVEVVEALMALWQETEFVSVDFPVSDMDIAALRQLKKRVTEVANEARGSGADKLKYCTKGVGGDNGCNLQVTVDSRHLDQYTAEVERVINDMPYNSFKISLVNTSSITKAIDIVNKAKSMKLIPIVSSGTASRIPKEGDNSIFFASPDDFDVDFCVGIGALQYHGNGVYEAEFSSRLNRLQDIQREYEKIRFVGSRFHVSSN